jgi:hypothetical protein
MSNLNDKTFISINEAAQAILAYGQDITPILFGEPGIGKTSILKEMRKVLGDEYDYIYIDCPVMDMSDIGMRVPNKDTGQLELYVSSLFKLGNGRKKVMLFDEFAKTPKLTQTIFTRALLERYVGDMPIEAGSYLFGTSNLSSDGVGDAMLAHGSSRVMKLYVSKSNAMQYLAWATENGQSPLLRAWVAMNPRSMASYLDDGQDDNPYIFNPKKKQDSYLCPRSYAKCDPIIRKRDQVGNKLTEAALAGTIGPSAAQSLAAFLSLEKELVSVKSIIKDPENTPIPDKLAALFMTMFNAVDTIETQDDLSSFMKYVNRVSSSELQSVFFTMLLQSKRTMRLARNNGVVMNWAKDNYELLV